ncbi:hypothetical protein DPX16_7434 [Anabarilius grahami]|uniref:Uncharacterized protein n=1 Tax=Anabarilius grahami TaxID=495550 RepID=A0A3N0Z416_ANAGA|nr:hypothetical protein DPX16_7434 [Anabarilius grahami]
MNEGIYAGDWYHTETLAGNVALDQRHCRCLHMKLQPLLYHSEFLPTSSELEVHSSLYRNSQMLLFGGSLRYLAQRTANVLRKPV